MVRILVGAQNLLPGRGGIAHVARLTVRALAKEHSVIARACDDEDACTVGGIVTRAAHGNRVRHVLGSAKDLLRCSHALYDFAGTGRGHPPLPRKPYAVWAHGYEVWSGNGLWNEPREDYQRVLHRADLVLVNSEYTRARAGHFLPAGDRVVVCPLGTWSDDSATAERKEGPPTVLLVGRVDSLFAKGHDLLIDAWPRVLEQVPDARLVFVGSGANLPKLRALVAASSARASIHVAGFVSDTELADYWRSATVFAMPGFGEGFGLVYIDAMQRGVPVIASADDAGCEVNVDGETGFNVPRSNVALLEEKLVTLLSNPTLARAMGDAGQLRWREKYSASGFDARLLKATKRFLT